MTNTPAGPNNSCDGLMPDITRHVDQLGDRFLDLLHVGQAPDRKEIVNAYRQLTTRLEQRLALIELMFDGQQDH